MEDKTWPLSHGTILKCRSISRSEQTDRWAFEWELSCVLEEKKVYAYALFRDEREGSYYLQVGPFCHHDAESALNYVCDLSGVGEEETSELEFESFSRSKDMLLVFHSLSLDDFVKDGKMYKKTQTISLEHGECWKTLWDVSGQ